MHGVKSTLDFDLAIIDTATLSYPGFGVQAGTPSWGVDALEFAVLAWSGSVAAGRSIEAMQWDLETGVEWTERDSRRAMARIGRFGAGVTFGASLATLPPRGALVIVLGRRPRAYTDVLSGRLGEALAPVGTFENDLAAAHRPLGEHPLVALERRPAGFRV